MNNDMHTPWTRHPEDDAWHAHMPEGWMQGRSVFGGLVGASAAALHARVHGTERTVRTITAQFLRPTSPGPITGRAEELRSGKHVTFSRATILQHDTLTYIADIVSTHPRQTDLIVPNTRQKPTCTPPEELDDLPYIEGLTPEFTQHFQMRWAHGGYPYSGSQEAYTIVHCRYRDVNASGLEGVLGLLDALPAPSLSLLSDFAAASSVSWTAHLVELPEHFDQWFTFTYETLFGARGFHTIVGYLYDADGALVAWTNQLAAVYG